MRRKFAILFITQLLFISVMAQQNMTRHILKSRPFSEIAIKGNARFECRENADSAGLIVYSATTRAANSIKPLNSGNTLYLSVDVPTGAGIDLNREMSPIVIYYTGDVSILSFSGSGTLYVPTIPSQRSLSVVVSGTGNVVLNNITSENINMSLSASAKLAVKGITTCSTLTCSVTGSGRISINRVVANRVNSTVKGAGVIDLNGSTQNVSLALKGSGIVDAQRLTCSSLDASIFGTGHIYYNKSVTKVSKIGQEENIKAIQSSLE